MKLEEYSGFWGLGFETLETKFPFRKSDSVSDLLIIEI
jgi:hypothetical protein